eukprot:c4177_g1_i1.p1 GENE.c4177_g1_i1~~c4177_g1_i1.p1  ORF type:complete len:149 (+),score=33.01 c4177_g1_i1:51-449(+)
MPKTASNSCGKPRKQSSGDVGADKADMTTKEPLNFSTIDFKLPQEELHRKFPLFRKAVKTTVEIQAGQMLFLPAGWFHEVESCGNAEGHLAFNYWFHPPDGNSFQKPYESEFWEKDWKIRQGTFDFTEPDQN